MLGVSTMFGYLAWRRQRKWRWYHFPPAVCSVLPTLCCSVQYYYNTEQYLVPSTSACPPSPLHTVADVESRKWSVMILILHHCPGPRGFNFISGGWTWRTILATPGDSRLGPGLALLAPCAALLSPPRSVQISGGGGSLGSLAILQQTFPTVNMQI